MLSLLAFYCCLLFGASAQIADNMLPFIGAPQGISFIADNNNYLARYNDGEYDYVVADRPNKDPFTKYFVHDVGDDLLAFECDAEGSGWFMQVVETWEFLLHCMYMGSVSELGTWNKFQTYSLDGGRHVAIRVPETETFLNRYQTDLDYMSPMDYSVTQYSTLGYDAGCYQLIEYEILEVVFDTSNQDPATYTPNIVDSAEIINDSGLPVERTVAVTYATSREETTNWAEHFGIMTYLSYSSGLIVKLVADIEFQLTLTYDYLTGGSTTETNEVSYSETVTVEAEPYMRTTVNLVVMQQEDAVIPFSARVKCTWIDDVTGQPVVTETWEDGTWSGVLLYKTYVKVHSEPL